jgi:transposase-like protein
MESGIKRTQRDYTLAFKLAVVEQVEKGELTYKQAQQRYGIQGRSTVLVWQPPTPTPGAGSENTC